MKEKIYLKKSNKPDKRYVMEFANKKVHFGQSLDTIKGKGTYLEHKDDKIKQNWIARHKVRENWNKPDTAGALSKHLLWNEKTLDKSIKNFEKKFSKYDIIKKV